MAVAFDAVSSATPTPGTTSPHTWTHTGVGSNLAVVAAICLDEATSGTTVACTYGGVAMTLIGQSAANTANNGILYFFGIAAAPTGAQTVSFTFSGTTDVCVGASVSWTGAGLNFGTAFGNLQPVPLTAGQGLAANPGLAVTCHSTASQAFCVIASGASAITSMGGGAQRFLDANTSAGDCGSIVGSNATGVNGNINFTSVIASGSFAIAGLEILPFVVPIGLPPQEAPGRKSPNAFRFRRPWFRLPNPKIENLIDNFATNDLAELWNQTVGTVVWSPGSVAIKSDTSYDSALVTNQAYDLTNSSIYIAVNPYVATSSDIQFGLFQGQFATSNNSLFIGFGGASNFHVFSTLNGVQTNLFTTTYNAVTMAWWRIRESGGTLFVDTAPDGLTWTNQFSTPDSTFSTFSLTDVGVSILGGDFGSDPAGTTTVFAVNSPLASIPLTVTAGLATGTGGVPQTDWMLTAGLATASSAAGTPVAPRVAGLATATGAAGTLIPAWTPGLATGLGVSQPVTAGGRIVGLASGVGAANAPPVGITPGLATGAGTAGNVTVAATGLTITAGLATASGAAGAPGVGITTGLASATGTSQPVTAPRTAGLATGTGSCTGPGIEITIGLATAAGAASEPYTTPGLASGTGAAGNPAVALTVGLATGTGSAGTPAVPRTAGLATGAGAASAPAVALTPGLATGSGATGNVAQPVLAGLASATGTSQSPGVGITTGQATATCAAGTPVAPRVVGLATGIGTALNVTFTSAAVITAGLATASGAAGAPGVGITTGLASATGSSQTPSPAWISDLATATGAAGAPTAPRTVGLATGAGSAGTPSPAWTPGLATGTGAALNVTFSTGTAILAGLASGAGAAGSPGIAILVGLATATGAAGAPTAPRTVGLATGTGAAQPVTAGARTVGLASGAGTAGNLTISILRNPLNLGGTVITVHTLGGTAAPITYDGTAATVASTLGGGAVAVTFDGGLVQVTYDGTAVTTANTYGGSLALPNFGGGAVPITLDGSLQVQTLSGTAATAANTYGGTLTLPNNGGGLTPVTIDGTLAIATLDGSAVTQANTYGGTLTPVTIDATLVGWTMQQVALTLAENNDESVNVTLTQNGSALSLSGATVNMYLKTAAGTPDGSATVLSSAGGSPAITITNSPGGLCTVAIPKSDLGAETFTFYRIDVVFSGLQNTAIYGSITWITL